jgi:protoheme IX farnesyltransferase
MSISIVPVASVSRREMVLAKLAAYAELSKPRIASLVLVVVAVSAMAAGQGVISPWTWIHTLIGTALVAASASTFNQIIERRSDALMQRTLDRPLPSARLSVAQTTAFGISTLSLGIAQLLWFVNPAAAVWATLTWVMYVAIYTPLKSQTTANTAVGAIAGALPVFIGWSAAGGSLSFAEGPYSGGLRAAALFLVVYLWQFPHFMAIAWIYRRQYAAANLKMLTVVDPTGRRAGAQAVLGGLALLPISLMANLQASAPWFSIGTTFLGVAYFAAAALFCWRRDDRTARGLLQTSLIYLPAFLVLLVLSPVK